MAAWNELLTEFQQQPDDDAKSRWLNDTLQQALRSIGSLRDDRNVLFYASSFLQKPQIPAQHTQITYEDLNGFMSVIFGMDFPKGLTLLLHTPGGVTNAAETLVAYLRTKFDFIEVVVPAFAMSAGTMMALGSDRIVMGRQSQLGPMDPQMPIPATGRFVSAQAIVDQFELAKTQIAKDPQAALAWAPILPSLGPALLVEARNALDYGEAMVANWLEHYMFRNQTDNVTMARSVAKYFNDAGTHKSHGRRIDREEARAQRVIIEDLEKEQDLQERVLTAYHVMTISFENSVITKAIISGSGRIYAKNWTQLNP